MEKRYTAGEVTDMIKKSLRIFSASLDDPPVKNMSFERYIDGIAEMVLQPLETMSQAKDDEKFDELEKDELQSNSGLGKRNPINETKSILGKPRYRCAVEYEQKSKSVGIKRPAARTEEPQDSKIPKGYPELKDINYEAKLKPDYCIGYFCPDLNEGEMTEFCELIKKAVGTDFENYKPLNTVKGNVTDLEIKLAPDMIIKSNYEGNNHLPIPIKSIEHRPMKLLFISSYAGARLSKDSDHKLNTIMSGVKETLAGVPRVGYKDKNEELCISNVVAMLKTLFDISIDLHVNKISWYRDGIIVTPDLIGYDSDNKVVVIVEVKSTEYDPRVDDLIVEIVNLVTRP